MSVDMIFNGHVIDIEASGLGAGSYPIEVGIVLANGFTYDSLIARPGFWTHWDEEAEKITTVQLAIDYIKEHLA